LALARGRVNSTVGCFEVIGEVLMAIVLRGKTKCSICDSVITHVDKLVATSHFISDPNDTLLRFSDSAMHSSCFLSWNHRSEFVAKYNLIVGSTTLCNGIYHRMEPDGGIAVLRRSH
jgi:hypothetical protein